MTLKQNGTQMQVNGFYALKNRGLPTDPEQWHVEDLDPTIGLYGTQTEAELARISAQQAHIQRWGDLEDTDFVIEVIV